MLALSTNVARYFLRHHEKTRTKQQQEKGWKEKKHSEIIAITYL